jgi:mannosyltransferase
MTATEEPKGVLHRATEGYEPNNPNSARINATILSLVRNEELEGMLQAMRDLERTWNHKFNYPWAFFNDVPFTEEFKTRTSKETKAKCIYGMLQLINPRSI